MWKITFIFAIVLLSLLLSNILMNAWTIIGIICSIILTVFSVLWGTYKIVEHALIRQDQKIEETLKSKHYFEEFKEHYNQSFPRFSYNLKEIDHKLDTQNKTKAEIESKIAEIESKIEELSQK